MTLVNNSEIQEVASVGNLQERLESEPGRELVMESSSGWRAGLWVADKTDFRLMTRPGLA